MIESILRHNIKQLNPYSSARDEFKGDDGLFFDANENPFGHLNRYPDPYQKKLKAKLASMKSVSTEQVFIGNGSDEVIDLLFRMVCEPGVDQVITMPPTYGMYQVSAGINDVQVIEVPLTNKFQIDFSALEKQVKRGKNIKMIFVCSPNNPSANSLLQIDLVCRSFSGLVVVDEAYIDFSEQESIITQIDDFPNLVITQTFSKAWGLAAARVGVCYTSSEIVTWLNRIKPPYNVSALNQKAALEALHNEADAKQNIQTILEQRSWLRDQLSNLPYVAHIYPTDANFLLIKVDDADYRYQQLIDQRYIVRNRSKLVDQCLRITVGTPEENRFLIKKMNEIT